MREIDSGVGVFALGPPPSDRHSVDVEVYQIWDCTSG